MPTPTIPLHRLPGPDTRLGRAITSKMDGTYLSQEIFRGMENKKPPDRNRKESTSHTSEGGKI